MFNGQDFSIFDFKLNEKRNAIFANKTLIELIFC